MARARAPRAPRGVARHRRRVHPPPRPVVRRVPGVAQAAPSRRVGRDRLAADVRRAGREPGRADDLPGGDGAGGRAARREHHRPHAGGPRDHGVGDRGAAAPVPARDPRGRRHLVPGLLRAGGGIRSRGARHSRGPGRRHLPRLGPEGVDVERPPEPVVHPARPDGPGGAEARGHLVPPRGHAEPGHHRPAAGAAHRRRGVQRGLLRGRPRAPGSPPRAARRRLEGRHHGPDARAHRPREPDEPPPLHPVPSRPRPADARAATGRRRRIRWCGRRSPSAGSRPRRSG